MKRSDVVKRIFDILFNHGPEMGRVEDRILDYLEYEVGMLPPKVKVMGQYTKSGLEKRDCELNIWEPEE